MLSKGRIINRFWAICGGRDYCKDTKKPTKPPSSDIQTDTKDPVPIAPKVIAKPPPIAELTRGRIYDPKTGTYKTVKVPPKAPKLEKPLINEKTEVLKKQVIVAFTSKEIVKQGRTENVSQSASGVAGGSSDPPANVPRLVRPEPERVMFCLFPYPWVKAFNNKTGITGFWTFLFTYGTYLLSKEKLVMEHEYYGGLSMIVLSALAVKYVGPSIAQSLDKQIDEIEHGFAQMRVAEKNEIQENIKHEEDLQDRMDAQLVVVEAKRENVHLQLEAEYRKRQMIVYQKVKSMLDFQVRYDEIQRRFAHEQMVRWTLQKVYESITDEIDSQYIDRCLLELDALAQKKQAI